MDRITVFYRTHDASIYASIGKDKIYNTFYLKLMDFDRVYRFPMYRLLKGIIVFTGTTVKGLLML